MGQVVVKSETGNIKFDKLMAKAYLNLKTALQLDILSSSQPLDVIKKEHDAVAQAILDPELFFNKFSRVLTAEHTPTLSKFLFIIAHIEEGLEDDLKQEYKQQPEIAASAKALLFYGHYIDTIREALEDNPNARNIEELIKAPVPTSDMAKEAFTIIQPYREAFVKFLKAGLGMAVALHPNKNELYQRELLEFSRLSAADQENNTLVYLRERLKGEDPNQNVDVDKLFATCQEIMRAGYVKMLISYRAEQLKYLAMALGIEDYQRYIHTLLRKNKNVSDEESEAVALIKLTRKFSQKKKIDALYKQLADRGYLQCDEQDFLGLFGKQNSEYEPKRVVWKAPQASLFYFLFALIKKHTEMDTMKIFVRVIDEWFVKAEEGKKVSFSNAINYHSALAKFFEDKGKNYATSKALLPSKEHVKTLNMILQTALSS